MFVTVALSQTMFRSIALVSLFLPRIAVVVIAVPLPEAGLVVVEHLESRNPLRALPEVEMRYEQPRGAAVFDRQRFTFVIPHDPRLAAGHVSARKVGGVPRAAHGE